MALGFSASSLAAQSIHFAPTANEGHWRRRMRHPWRQYFARRLSMHFWREGRNPTHSTKRSPNTEPGLTGDEVRGGDQGCYLAVRRRRHQPNRPLLATASKAGKPLPATGPGTALAAKKSPTA